LAAITSAGRAAGLEPLELVVDARAAEALYERHSKRVFGYCLSRLGRREDAEDAVQTTFLHAVRGLRRGVVPAMEVAWLLGIARNVCLSRWEVVGRRSRLESPCDPFELDRSRAAPQGRGDELIGLEDALSKLPDQQRRAVLLRDWRGLSYAEIADELDVSLAAVETLIFRGRRTLSELLHEEPPAIRRRLRSLGDLGSLLTAVKTAVTGGVAATKVAMTVIAAVAIVGAGAAAGTSLEGSGRAPLEPAGAKPARVDPSAPAVASLRRVPAVHAVASAPGPAKPEANVTRPTVSRASVPLVPVAERTAQTPAAPVPEPALQPQQPPRAPVAAVPSAAGAVPAVTHTVEKTVDPLLPSLPIDVPSLPEPPVAVQLPDLPAVVATPPVTVSLPPVEVSPPKLLP
jgi:RNA polymerase sigma-70 factor (ECF subfamily)